MRFTKYAPMQIGSMMPDGEIGQVAAKAAFSRRFATGAVADLGPAWR
jgi:hypothetical protein